MKTTNNSNIFHSVTLNGTSYTLESLLNYAQTLDINAKTHRYLLDIIAFIQEWFSVSTTIEVKSSGSTGEPKRFNIEKEKMIASARTTCSFLGLIKGDTALLSMPLQYIAGKMMLVRAIVAELNIIPVTPCGNPLAELNSAPIFAAMVPLQVYNSIHTPREFELLKNIKQLIIGGGSIDHELADKLRPFPNNVWSTYGMTETLSHIAMRKLNGPNASDWYTPFPNVHISESKDDTLIIDAPAICDTILTTNDICSINSLGQFRILGRKDNIINTGGIKIQIEEVESSLKPLLSFPFIITSIPNPKLGEELVLLVQKGTNQSLIEQACSKTLTLYQRPKKIITLHELPYTETDKPNRALAKQFANDTNKIIQIDKLKH